MWVATGNSILSLKAFKTFLIDIIHFVLFRLQSPVPESLCANTKINNGNVRALGCDAIACPLGTYSDIGYAIADAPCHFCPQGYTTLYLGSPKCYQYSQRDFLSMFFDIMEGENWIKEYNENWKSDANECEWVSKK